MHEAWERAKARYQDIPIPEELDGAVSAALAEGKRRQSRRRAVRRAWSGGLAACVCFCLLVNGSPAFASAMESIPVLGQLARVVTVEHWKVEDRRRVIDVRMPALADTGNTELERRLNDEIRAKIDAIVAQAEEEQKNELEAYLATGGKWSDYEPLILDVDYEVKCSSEQYLSFVITATRVRATSYTELYIYDLDRATGADVSLRDLLGKDWKARCDAAVRAGIAKRTAEDPKASYFTEEGGFSGVGDDQKFYIREDGTPVLVFEKYQVAPGYMGIQEFPVEAE